MTQPQNEVVAAARRHGRHAMTLIGNTPDVEHGRRVAPRGVPIVALGTGGEPFAEAIARLSAIKE